VVKLNSRARQESEAGAAVRRARSAIAELIAALRDEIGSAPPADLPAIISQIEGLKAEAWARLVTTPLITTSKASSGPSPKDADVWLTLAEAAIYLKRKPRWVREHSRDLGASELPGRGGLRFSRRRLELSMRRRSVG
jgi:hypothetical protein